MKSDEAVRHIQRASSDLWALYEVAQTLSSSLGLSETLEILGRKLGAILPNTACLFLLKAEQSEALVVRTAVGINSEFLRARGHSMSPASRTPSLKRSRLIWGSSTWTTC